MKPVSDQRVSLAPMASLILWDMSQARIQEMPINLAAPRMDTPVFMFAMRKIR